MTLSRNLSTLGQAVSVSGNIPSANVTGLAASATTDTTNANNITSGTLSASRLASPVANTQTFTSTGTWNKPTGGQTMARIQCWGGGGGGARSAAGSPKVLGGGGGGGYFELTVPLLYLASSVTATVGAGGTGATATGNGGNGGLTSFALATAWNGISSVTGGGGGGGNNTDLGAGSGGGARTSAATSGASGALSTPGAGYSVEDPNAPGTSISQPSDWGALSDFATVRNSFYGGGTGGWIQIGSGAQSDIGGCSNWGGGGGVPTGQTGGLSYFGGAGGVGASGAGTAPGGGGGCSASLNQNGGNGAAGRIIVTCW